MTCSWQRHFVAFIALILNLATATNGLLPAKSDFEVCTTVAPNVIQVENPTQGLECRAGLPSTGLGVNVTLEWLSLEANYGDYLVINPGTTTNIKQTAIFTWNVKNPVHVVMPARDDFSLRLKVGERPAGPQQRKANGMLGFKLRFTTFDVPTPPPTTPITTTPLPQPPDDEPWPSYMVYVGGILPQNLADRTEEFRQIIADKSNEYCRIAEIALEQPIRPEHVQLLSLRQCPLNWPNAEYCSEIKLAVPAFLEDPNKPYELSVISLEKMWTSNRTLPDWLTYYEKPSSDLFFWWLGVFFGIVFLFIGTIMLAWRVRIYRSTIGNLMVPNEKTDSLWPQADASVSSPQAQVPPYLVIDQPVNDAASRKFYYEERNSYANPEPMRGVINEAYEFEDDDDALDIVASRNIYDYPDQPEYDIDQNGIILGGSAKDSEITL
ncbi:uncharacterized protein LOC135940737 isoform X1 [Cloeon dipterum]|uniref:uncharacterized protein LOC135940737 isoform X1 n=1 Tax=Cloeon dipterum TaxID=197152 RepID=UPI00321FFAD0